MSFHSGSGPYSITGAKKLAAALEQERELVDLDRTARFAAAMQCSTCSTVG